MKGMKLADAIDSVFSGLSIYDLNHYICQKYGLDKNLSLKDGFLSTPV
jgi:hypothetical protein